MNWRPIPFIQYTINHPQGSEIWNVFKKVFWSINLSLLKTFKGQKYKKFAIFFSLMYGKNESIFEIMCHEVEFVANFVNFMDEKYSEKEVVPVFEGMKGQFSKLINSMPLGKHIAATIIYDEQVGEITLDINSLNLDTMTTSWLLFFLEDMISRKMIFDSSGIIVDNYNLRKLVFYNMDTEELDFSRIQINVDNYEEWDYYYPEYDREEEIYRQQYKAKIEKDFSENLLEIEELNFNDNEKDFLKIIDKIIVDFKNLVENRGYRLLWDEYGNPRDEESCQILFDIYAKKYCQNVGIDLTREVETGRGPVDFRLSSNAHFTAHVEFKKESNSKLSHGLTKQLPTYMSSEDAKIGFFVIFDFGTRDISKLKNDLEAQRIELERDKEIILRVVYIDARMKLSASKL
ncbi:MAG: hypothetical protein ACPK85_05325 [Methanosarcina sp.]